MNRVRRIAEEAVFKPTFSRMGLMDRKVESGFKNPFSVRLQASSHEASCREDKTIRREECGHRGAKHFNPLTSFFFYSCPHHGITHEKRNALLDQPLFEPVENSLSGYRWRKDRHFENPRARDLFQIFLNANRVAHSK